MRCAFWGVSREEGSQEVSPSICHRPSIWKVRNRRPLWTCPGRVVHCQKKLILLQKCSLSRSATRLWSQDHREAETTQGFLGRWPQGSLCPRTGDVTFLTPGSCHSMKWGENLQNRICCMWYLHCERVLWEQGQCSVCVCGVVGVLHPKKLWGCCFALFSYLNEGLFWALWVCFGSQSNFPSGSTHLKMDIFNQATSTSRSAAPNSPFQEAAAQAQTKASLQLKFLVIGKNRRRM